MRPYVVIRYAGMTLVVLAVVMLLMLAYSLAVGDGAWAIFLYSGLIIFFMGIFPVLFVPHERQLSEREGYSIVVYAWLSVCFFGMIPYALYGEPFDLAAAWFESTSGFTTTGATVLSNMEDLPKSLVMYHAATHWVGGMGVVVFILLVLPSLGKARMTLSRSEISQIAWQDYRQRTGRVLQQMAVVYVGITLASIAALLALGVPVFDAVFLSFSSVATGGFSPRAESIAAYHSGAVEVVLAFFMVLSSVHFGLLFSAARGDWRGILHSRVVRFFLGLLGSVVLVVALNLHFAAGRSWGASLREGGFMVASIMTTTGFATADANAWPQLSQLMLLLVMLAGGCSGSTAGGMKVDRLMVMVASVQAYVSRLRHPQGIIRTRIGREVVSEEAVISVYIFIASYIALALCHTVLIMLLGFDLKTSLSTTLACMTNSGPGMGLLSTFDGYGMFTDVAKVSFGMLMIVGRLEIFGLLLVVLPKRFG